MINETCLTEKNWKYKLDKTISLNLRDAIAKEDYVALKQALRDAWTWIYNFTDMSEYEAENKISDVEVLDVEPNEEIDIDFSDIEDNFNYELDDLYDYCDVESIWIEV